MSHYRICAAPVAWRCRAVRAALAATTLVWAAGCKGLLDVENPNNIAEGALDTPQSANQQANGVLASTVRMLSAVMTPYATATDELDWIGSRDAWLDLERGAISNYLNEFTDQAFPFVGEARFLGDKTIERLEGFDAEGRLRSRESLARTYLYTGIVYASIADMWDDFAFSDKTNPAPAVGRGNMGTLYDKAIGYLDKALAITAAGTGEDDLRYAILSTRARVKHGKAVWTKITPEGRAPTDPLVNDAGAVTDASNALALLPGADDKFKLVSNVETQPDINIWFEVNGRNETAVGEAYTSLIDPISGAADPAAGTLVAEFKAYGENDGVFTLMSDRELRLILAEAALARSDLLTFANEINAVRNLDNLPPWTGQIPAVQMLKHERMANLFMQLRRLGDLYRFGDNVAEWTTDPNFKSAVNTPGLLFPIPNIERLANPCAANPGACQ
jgi:hypothetical protein